MRNMTSTRIYIYIYTVIQLSAELVDDASSDHSKSMTSLAWTPTVNYDVGITCDILC